MKRNSNNRQRTSSKNTLGFEKLEPRQLMAGDLSNSGVWTINGTSAADEIYLARDANEPNYLIAEVNGRVVSEQLASDVTRFVVNGFGGDDHIEIDETVGKITTPATLLGHNGNDILIGGSGRDYLNGGNGDDELYGRDGDDWLFGQAGDDYLEGGAGKDYLNGGSGDNELVPDFKTPQTQTKTRVPAEWEPHDSTWLQWPKGEEKSYRSNFVGIIKALQKHEQVNLAVETAAARTEAANYLSQNGVPLNNIQFHIMPYDWSWMRDNGAIWVEKTDADGQRSMAVQDWGFDGWGGDGGPSRKDDAVPTYVAKIENVAYEKIDVVLEKGTLEFNGSDTLITSWTVLHNRNPNMSQPQLESVLKEKFGVTNVVWVSGASAGDLTDGHIDGIARFVNSNTVVVGRYADQSDPDAKLFEDAAKTIREAGLNVVRMNIPGYVKYQGEWLPANYTNYLVANGVVIASSYGNAQFDNAAKAQLQQIFPGREVVMTDTRELWYNGGAVHCVTNDQPLLRPSPAPASQPVSGTPAQKYAGYQQSAEPLNVKQRLQTRDAMFSQFNYLS